MLLLGWPIVLDDLEDVDARYHSNLKSLEQIYLLPQQSHPVAQEATMKASLALVPNGSSIAADEKNLPEYIDSCFQYRMFGQYHVQLSELILGFLDVVPEPLLAVFDYEELEAAMCGSYMDRISEVDVEQPIDAIVRLAPQRSVSSSSYPPAIPVPEALLVEEPLYDAIAEPVIQRDRDSEQNSTEKTIRSRKDGAQLVECKHTS